MDLLDLRKYAIDNRVEIMFGDASAQRECVVKSNGRLNIPGENKNFRIEEVFEAADMFIVVGGDKPGRYSPESFAGILYAGTDYSTFHTEEEE